MLGSPVEDVQLSRGGVNYNTVGHTVYLANLDIYLWDEIHSFSFFEPSNSTLGSDVKPNNAHCWHFLYSTAITSSSSLSLIYRHSDLCQQERLTETDSSWGVVKTKIISDTCQTVAAGEKKQNRNLLCPQSVSPYTQRVLCLSNVCMFVCVCRYGCESWIICRVLSLLKCSFWGFGKSPCRGNKKLQHSDPVLADISQNIVGHSGNKKLPCYGNCACELKSH